MCPSCVPALPLLSGTVTSARLIPSLRTLFIKLSTKFKKSRMSSVTTEEKHS